MDTTVERAFQKLEANLEELTKIYRSLLDIVRKEKELLLKADRISLEESNKLKEDLLFKLRAQDSLRSRYAMDLAGLIGADIENPRLLELAQKMAGSPAADRLRTQHSALDMLIKRITVINKENEEYANSALSTLNGAMNEIKETLSGKKTYEKKGGYKSGPQVSGNFVSKEA
ncbi:flagellar protein FlgN [Bdellovibrio reynosensis]|uniref:Flagellar protein FlgN n=1 Tax=Bdellovibrio reynosensis TaxID=2835041 RepID=A0ABY4C4P7_9BACT|nr:flagellar protein FlgN [Bdellovibrio reynosensis]UOE99916.1 flagellar protein FlgN [Bdellovibrio reynosensis]